MIALESLSRPEKLRMMEALWEDLSRSEAEFVSPAWHGRVLADTERAVAAGDARFVSFDEARSALLSRP
ncbi:addiction module protein [Nevskia sp.]|uniref:addiction module protein n=1 Tax=Nevskia sp. TaxID=1929292 RepID=UPI0025FFF345|nr:addiction module protein [Nevskia sp.]